MSTKAYLSNLSHVWPFSRQEIALANATIEWPDRISIYRDSLSANERRAHKVGDLVNRAAMLRPTSRRTGETIYIASLAVFAWSAEDMMSCLTQALARGATVHVVDAGLAISPQADPATLHRAAQAFADGRRSRAAGEAGMTGGEVSGSRRAAAARLSAKTIEREWSLPSEEYPTRDLLRAAGISRNTAKLYLGSRRVAQNNYQAGQKRRNSAYAKRGSSAL